jgi:predicted regulator of amino acid metabolism with ACT domain
MIPGAKLTLVVEGQVPGEVLAELNSLKAVRSVTVVK